MDAVRDDIAAWIAREILPHEGIVRNWLARRWGHMLEVDDVVQEAYCRLTELDYTRHIRNGRAYFFTTVRAVAIDAARAAKVANVRNMTEIDWMDVMDGEPLPDRAVEAGQELARVEAILSGMSWTCRQVIELRRIHGLSQAETAREMGITEHVVENHIARGLRRLLKAFEEQDTQPMQKSRPDWAPGIRPIAGTSAPPAGRHRRRMAC